MNIIDAGKGRVSVVIPAYRAAGTIRRAIDSILAQTLPAAEIVVVDDGSPDDLQEAIAIYGEQVILIPKENGGAASARNLGIERAKGDFIAFLDADDYWQPEKLERQLAVLARHSDVGLVSGQYFVQQPHGPSRAALPLDNGFDRVLSLRGPDAFFAATRIWTGTVIVRRQVLGAYRFVSGLEPAEDRDLWVRIAASTAVYMLSEPLATAVLEVGSLSRSNVTRDCSNMLRVVDRNKPLIGRSAARMWQSHTYFRWGACEPNPKEAILKLGRSWWLWPLPFPRNMVNQFGARAKATVVMMRRLVRRQREARKYINEYCR